MHANLSAVGDLTSAQLALVTNDQLRERGITKQQLSTLVTRRVLERVRPGVYAMMGAPKSWEQGLLTALLSVGRYAAASHASATQLWVCRYRLDERYEITVASDQRPRLKGVRTHRSTRLDPADVVVRSGIRTTSFERTICDCTTRLSSFQLGRNLDDGLRRGVASLQRLKECAERLESGPGRHMSVVRELLAKRGIDYNPGDSGSELRVLDLYVKAGIPRPVQQLRVKLGVETYDLDFSWPDAMVFAEFYGGPFHIGASAVAYDSRRLTSLVAAGWTPLVFTDDSSNAEIVERTAAVLASRGVWTPRTA
jgi:hypothetical protein